MNINEEIDVLLGKLEAIELSDKKNLYIINNEIKSLIEKNLKEIDINTVKNLILSEKYVLNKKEPGLFILNKMMEKKEFNELSIKIVDLFNNKQREKVIADLAYSVLEEFRAKKWTNQIDESIVYVLTPYILTKLNSNERIKHMDFLINNNYVKTIENHIAEKTITTYLEEKKSLLLEDIFLKKTTQDNLFKNIHLIKERSQLSILKKYDHAIENIILESIEKTYSILPIRTKELKPDAYKYILEKCMEIYAKNKYLMFELFYNSFRDDFLNRLPKEEVEESLNNKYEIDFSKYIRDFSKQNAVYKKTLKLNFIQKRFLEKDETSLIKEYFHIFNQKVIEKNNMREKEFDFCDVLQNTTDISNKLYLLLEFETLLDNQDHLTLTTFMMEKYINSKTDKSIIKSFNHYTKEQKENIVKAYEFLTDCFNFKNQEQKDKLKKIELLISSIILDLELNNNNKLKTNKIKI